MARQVVIGIDLGTTVVKAAVFDAASGSTRAEAAHRLHVRILPDGGREQDLPAVDAALNTIITQLRQKLGADWRTVSGIGLAAQGGSTIIADRVTGKPHTPMMLWNDGRARPYVRRIAQSTSAAFWEQRVMCSMPPAGLGRLLWLQDTRPRLFQENRIHAGVGEYLFHRLTGVWRQDPGNAFQTGAYNAHTKQLDPAAFDLIGVPLSFVAPLRREHETAPLSQQGARMLGLSAGIPVAGPYIDQEAGYLSAVALSCRPLHCSLGTAWVGNFCLPDDTTGTSPTQIVLPDPSGHGRLVVQVLLTGNPTWDWALRTLLGKDQKLALTQAAGIFRRRLLPPDGLLCLPWLAQANPLEPAFYGGGTFLGLNPDTSAADLLRAVPAGMAFELARIFDDVKRSNAVDSVVIGGGAGNGVYFRTLIAALFAPLPVRWQTHGDLAGARGAIYALSATAAQAKTRRVPPPPATRMEAIRKAYNHYLAAFDRVYGTIPISRAFHFRANPSKRARTPRRRGKNPP